MLTTGGQVNKSATLRVGIDSAPVIFDPIQSPGNQGNYTLPELYDQLVQLDADFQPQAMLATSWEYNADGTQLTMKLRDDATFNSDGSPVTAESFVKAWNYTAYGPNGQQGASFFEQVQGYDQVNPSDPDGDSGPAKTPAPVIAKINAETIKFMKSPEFQKIRTDTGSDYVGDTPANFAKFVQAESAKWSKVAKQSGATVD